jgi:hypothetical protein
MDEINHECSIYVRVFDAEALYQAAMAKMEQDGIEDAEESLRPNGEIDTAKCLQMLLDPGESPPGCQILDSACE